jgi:glycosyltransferase 2 family protein
VPSHEEPAAGGGLARLARSVWFRLAVTAALLAVLATQIDWDAAWERVSGGSPGWLVLGVGALLAGLLAGAARWHLLLPQTPWREALRAYFVGAFANNFLPTGFGGDAVRSVAAARGGTGLAMAAATVLVDRLTALGSLLLLGWAMVIADGGAVPQLLVGLLAALSALVVAAYVPVRWASSSAWLRTRVPRRLVPLAVAIGSTLRALARDRALLARFAVLGLVYQALVVASVWCGARTIGLHLPYALLAVAVPLVLVLTALPVSLAGFGVREGSFAVLLGTAGVAATDATLISLLSVVTLALASLPGAVAIVRGRRHSDA